MGQTPSRFTIALIQLHYLLGQFEVAYRPDLTKEDVDALHEVAEMVERAAGRSKG